MGMCGGEGGEQGEGEGRTYGKGKRTRNTYVTDVKPKIYHNAWVGLSVLELKEMGLIMSYFNHN